MNRQEQYSHDCVYFTQHSTKCNVKTCSHVSVSLINPLQKKVSNLDGIFLLLPTSDFRHLQSDFKIVSSLQRKRLQIGPIKVLIEGGCQFFLNL